MGGMVALIKVTAYCRVSTDNDDQLNSLVNQEKYFADYINSQPNWEYVPLYADEGISGTSTKKRKNFNKMISDAHLGKFNLILTKEVSRFARNTVDTLQYTRELKDINVGVLFMSDNINSMDSDGELRLTIMSGIAQDESRRTSERVKWGQQRSMEKGVVFGHTILGYKIKNGVLEVDPAEANTVRIIFRKYLEEAKGLPTIAKELECAGLLTSYGKKRWDATAVQRILTNEKYAGDLKQKKFITPNYLTHQIKRNKGEEEFVIIKNNHEAIIERDVFEKVQQEMASRGLKINAGTKHTQRYAFSGKLRCGFCDSTFISRSRRTNNGQGMYKRWQCSKYFKYGSSRNNTEGCENTMIRNEILEHVFRLALRDSAHNKDKLIDDCVKMISSTLNADQIQSDYKDAGKELERLTGRLNNLIDLRLDGEISKEELKIKRESLDVQIVTAQEKLKQLENNAELVDQRDALMKKIKERITDIVTANVFSEEIAKEKLDKIIIYGKDQFDVYLRGNPVSG